MKTAIHRAAMRFAAVATLVFIVTGALAQSYPAKPIRYIVPTSPGTPPDVVGRIIAAKLQAALRQPVIVDNRPGASQAIGIGELVKLPADGYTMLGVSMPNSVLPSLFSKLPFDLRKDLAPVGQFCWSSNVLVVGVDEEARSARELVGLTKVHPNRYSFASGGNGTPAHLSGELFKLQSGADVQHVPYNQFSQAIADVIAARVQFMFMASVAAIAQINGGKLRALAVTGPHRLSVLPQVPTMMEQGFPDFDVRDWQGLVVRDGTPAPIVARLNAELDRVLSQSDVREHLAKLGADVQGGSPEDFRQLMDAEIDRWAKVVKAAGIKPE